MSVQPCSFEVRPPVEEGLRPAKVHPDPEVYAKMAAIARGQQPRRFAFCRRLESASSPNVLVEYLGWRYQNGITITDRLGRPTTRPTSHPSPTRPIGT